VKKVIVTGGAGYIGSHTVVELAKAGYQPIIVDNFCASEQRMVERLRELVKGELTKAERTEELAVHEVDCRDRKRLLDVFERTGDVFGVIHFAAHKSVGVSVREPREYYDNNLGSLLCLLDVMRERGVGRLVFSSSCTVYGQPQELPVTEDTALPSAESPYGSTKQMCERIISDVARSGALLQCVTLRYFNPIGAHPSGQIGELPLGTPATLVPYITQTAVGLREELVVYGNQYPTRDGTCVRDYLHILDLADAHVAALDWLGRRELRAENEIFNLGTGRGVSVLEAITAFEEASGERLKYRIGPPRPGDAAQVYANADKAQRELGWQARRSLVEAMGDAYRWEKNVQAWRAQR
jgi:UDP-glucose 4-epimerase